MSSFDGLDLPTLEERVRRHPDDDQARLSLSDRLAALGERDAARGLLAPLEVAGHPARAAAVSRLATLDEHEGRFEAAAARWERLLADDIDHPEAWAHLSRLRQAEGPPPVPPGLVPAPPTLESAAGVAFSRLRIVRELGRGGSATVYLARDEALALDLALKVLHPRGGGPSTADVDRRFFHEARTAAALRHPGVVAIYDVDEAARALVMEFLAGGTLRDRLRSAGAPGAGLPADEVNQLARHLLETLDYVHRRGVVHGDITPRNVLLRRPGNAVLVDFGIARLREAPVAAGEQPAGTPLYLAPEQLRGAPATVATDLFAVGTVLWEAATGRPMRTHADLIAGRLDSRALTPEARARLDAPTAATIEVLLAVSPERRPAGARQALDLLGTRR